MYKRQVLTLQHGNGTGRNLLEQSLKAIKENMKCKKIVMDAQKYAVGFYEKFGFKDVYKRQGRIFLRKAADKMDQKEILSHVDHTQLKAFATWEDIQKLCEEALSLIHI